MDEQNQQALGNVNLNPPEKEIQNMQQVQPVQEKLKAPILVRILAMLMMIVGVSSAAYFIYLSVKAITEPLNFPWLIWATFFLFAAVFIIAAWGLRDMKKWGLYFVISLLSISILFSLFDITIKHSGSLIYELITVIINGAIIGYLLHIKNKFEPEKPHQPGLIIAMACAALVLPILSYIAFTSFERSQEKEIQTMTMDMVDRSIKSNVAAVAIELMDYDIDHDTYKGFPIEDTKSKELENIIGEAGCKTAMKVDISPDGKKFVVYQPLCSDLQKSACFEDDMTDSKIVDTAKVEKTYSCK